jgi:ubiquinone/menaquinone biosynthesis C-methylase UbiE
MIGRPMNAIVERYDQDAEEYARYWAPVLERTSQRLLDYVAEFADAKMREAGALRVVEVGTGTGSLLGAMLRRWPGAQVVATDAARGMVELARRRLDSDPVLVSHSSRVEFITASADALPLETASVDLIVSTFVLQLVPDRRAALREAARILRTGGRVAYLTWLDRDSRRPFLPAEEFDEAVLDLGIEEPEVEEEPHAGDVPSGRSAAAELRRAGLANASASEATLEYDWTADSYLEYKLCYDERFLMGLLTADQQTRLERNARERLARLDARDFRWHAPVVFARGDHPG